MAGVLLVVIPDRRLILSAAYAPIILLAPRLGWSLAGTATHPTGATLVFRNGVIPWPVVNQFLLIAGGLLWAATAMAYVDHDAAAAPWTAPEAAARWGRWAVAVAVIAPLRFIITRLAWAAGIPLGISEEFFREGRASGLWRVGTALVMVTTEGWALIIPALLWPVWGAALGAAALAYHYRRRDGVP
jgi:hypothetical protein